MSDQEYIDIAIEISKTGKYPYGAIIVKDGSIIGRSDDRTITETGMYTHAELEAIESACSNKNLYGELKGATLYVSCEPCMMCMGAIMYQGITKIVYAATLQDSNDYYCPETVIDIKELAKYSDYEIEIVPGIHRDKAIEVLKNFREDDIKTILITGAVLATDEILVENYKSITSIIESSEISEHTKICGPLDTMKFSGTDQEKYERAMNIVSKSKAIIAEMSTISTGQGMELEEAIKYDIPVLVIAKTGSKISSLVKGAPNIFDIIYYDDINSIKDDILNFLKNVL